jgi:regulation of enolase protein 1 (concanavalin A-like superfamily)
MTDLDGQAAIGWDSATWLNPPAAVTTVDNDLIVTATAGSDFWRTTSYGFIHDDGHALLVPLPAGHAVEVSFVADFGQQFDQAGVLVHVDDRNWIKSGVEFCDGAPQLGGVVTREFSDWSAAPVPDWFGHLVTIRTSRSGDALAVRARRDDGPWQMIRLAPLAPDAQASAGPFCCAPSRDADTLTVRFTRFSIGPADESLH